jgi:hypothetical protein
VLQGLNQESLLRQQAATTGSAYEKAYNAAVAQFNADQGNQRSNLTALSTAGGTQHEREQAALDAQYNEWLRQTKYPKEQLEEQKGLISALAPTLPKTQVKYGQKESALQQLTAGTAGLTKFAKDLGYESITDLAKGMGIPIEKLASVFGITTGPDTSDVKSTGQTGLPSSETGGGYTPDENGLSPPPPGYHRDAEGNLVMNDTVTTMPVNQTGLELFDPNNYVGVYAEGGLIDLLHKMRGHK